MNKPDYSIDKSLTAIIKGCGILFIILHNYLHADYFGFATENEFWYSDNNVSDFFERAVPFGLNTFGNLFSYIGWIGVVAFLFLSGYGLMVKYENTSVDARKYIFHSFFKLFVLLAPVLLYFGLVEKEGILGFIRAFFPLSMLNNLVVNFFPFSPGIYWYFGLIFELYILFLIWKDKSVLRLSIWMVVLLVLQILAFELEPAFPPGRVWIKYNITGWGQVFILGIIMAKYRSYFEKNSLNIWILTVVMIFSLFLSCVLQYSKILWILFVPFLGVVFFISLSKLIGCVRFISKPVSWLGKYSASIFVTHPVIRSLFYMFLLGRSNDFLLTVLYIICCLLIAYIYSFVYNRFLSLENSFQKLLFKQ